MSKLHIIKGEFQGQLSMQLAPAIKAGFPSPADDYSKDSLDFNRDMIPHPESTFYARVDGDSMIGAGIDSGDIAVIDRLQEPADGDIIVAFVEGEFTIKFLDLSHREEGYIQLKPANPQYPVIRIDETDTFQVWGVVIYTIKKWKR